ncbi:MAG: DUF2300 domain-containing protein [Azoarcus sp.]|nr:DUF2300 domain-containing protein [Azoarcus sp.]
MGGGSDPRKNRHCEARGDADSNRHVDRRAGQPWDIILRRALPAVGPGAPDNPAGISCRRLAIAENWLARAPRRHRVLQEHLPGFEPPPTPRVCLFAYGASFSG